MPFHQILFLVLLAAVCAYACVRGGPPERLVATAFLVAALLTALLQAVYRSIEIGILLVDAGLLALMLAIALASTRFWPLLMTSLQGSEVLGHFAKLLAPETVPEAYFAVVAFWGFPMLALLAWGTWRHRRRLRRYGIDHDWACRLPVSYREGYPADG